MATTKKKRKTTKSGKRRARKPAKKSAKRKSARKKIAHPRKRKIKRSAKRRGAGKSARRKSRKTARKARKPAARRKVKRTQKTGKKSRARKPARRKSRRKTGRTAASRKAKRKAPARRKAKRPAKRKAAAHRKAPAKRKAPARRKAKRPAKRKAAAHRKAPAKRKAPARRTAVRQKAHKAPVPVRKAPKAPAGAVSRRGFSLRRLAARLGSAIKPPIEAYSGSKPYLFASYSHKNMKEVFGILKKLAESRFRIWYDEGIEPGNEWPEEVGRALTGCRLFVVFMSPQAMESRNVRNEINLASSENKDIMVVNLQPAELSEGMKLQIGTVQYINKHQMAEEEFMEKLKGVLNPDLRG
jgi:hypothetical protein